MNIKALIFFEFLIFFAAPQYEQHMKFLKNLSESDFKVIVSLHRSKICYLRTALKKSKVLLTKKKR